MTTARLYNMLYKTSEELPWTAEYKREQTEITRGIIRNIHRTLDEHGLKYQFRFAGRQIKDNSTGEQAYMTPAALAAIQTVPDIEKIFPMAISLYPLSREL